MRNLLSLLFLSPLFKAEAHHAYAVLVSQARRPEFYTRLQVPDTLDGRFDVIVLHLFLLIRRLRAENGNDDDNGAAAQFTRALSEAFFADMDCSLREVGASDTGVGKRMKKMSQAFFGRLKAYDEAFSDEAAFSQSLARNLYRSQSPGEGTLAETARYCRVVAQHLASLPIGELLRGQVAFPLIKGD